MKNKGQVALAVGAGYLLGRRRKMRLALVLGTAAATGGFGGLGGQLLRRGAKLAGSDRVLGKVSPELAEIGQMVRGDLLDAGKAAGMTVVRSRIDHLSDKLHDQAEQWRQAQRGDVEAEPDRDAGEGTAPGPEGGETGEPADTGEPVDTAEEPEHDDADDAYDEAEDYEDAGDPDDAEDDYSEPGDGEKESQETEDLPARPAANGGSRRRRPERAAPPVRRTRR